MDLARVVGTVTMTVKHPVYIGRKVLMLRALDAAGEPAGGAYAAVDLVRAGRGDTVLVNREGSAARERMGDPRAPVRSLVVGVVDEVNRTDGWRP